jgi:hypothetical protein
MVKGKNARRLRETAAFPLSAHRRGRWQHPNRAAEQPVGWRCSFENRPQSGQIALRQSAGCVCLAWRSARLFGAEAAFAGQNLGDSLEHVAIGHHPDMSA